MNDLTRLSQVDLELQYSIFIHYNRYGQLTDDIRRIGAELERRWKLDRVDWLKTGF